MYSNQIKNKAIIISIKDNNNEIKQLINSLDYKVFKIFIQNKKIPDVNSYIGRGKVEEIYNFIRKSNESIDLIVVDGKLKPSQWFNLEKKFNIKVFIIIFGAPILFYTIPDLWYISSIVFINICFQKERRYLWKENR